MEKSIIKDRIDDLEKGQKALLQRLELLNKETETTKANLIATTAAMRENQKIYAVLLSEDGVSLEELKEMLGAESIELIKPQTKPEG